MWWITGLGEPERDWQAWLISWINTWDHYLIHLRVFASYLHRKAVSWVFDIRNAPFLSPWPFQISEYQMTKLTMVKHFPWEVLSAIHLKNYMCRFWLCFGVRMEAPTGQGLFLLYLLYISYWFPVHDMCSINMWFIHCLPILTSMLYIFCQSTVC